MYSHWPHTDLNQFDNMWFNLNVWLGVVTGYINPVAIIFPASWMDRDTSWIDREKNRAWSMDCWFYFFSHQKEYEWKSTWPCWQHFFWIEKCKIVALFWQSILPNKRIVFIFSNTRVELFHEGCIYLSSYLSMIFLGRSLRFNGLRTT